MEWISRIPDLLKLPAKYFALAALVTGAILFLPDNVIRQLRVEAVPQKFGFWLGLVFLVCSSLVLVNVFSWVADQVRVRRQTAKRKKVIEEHLAKLDVAEKAVLREFFIGGQNTIRLPLDHPVVAGLISRGVIRPVGSFGERSLAGMLFSFTISEGAEELITPEVLGIASYLIDHPDGKWMVNDEGIQWITDNRPVFVAEIERHQSRFRRW